MSVTALTNLAELASNQSLVKNTDVPNGVPAVTPQAVPTSALPSDSFTPSSQIGSAQSAAEEAGLFQVSQVAASIATVDVPSSQTTLQHAPQNGASTQLAQPGTNNTAPAQGPATTVTNVQPPTPPPAPATPVPADGTLGEPETLNATLVGLGLNNGDIQFIDRVASSINNFNPTLFTDLVQQFQERATEQAVTTQPTATATPAKVTSS